jgi:hypothetical protein
MHGRYFSGNFFGGRLNARLLVPVFRVGMRGGVRRRK